MSKAQVNAQLTFADFPLQKPDAHAQNRGSNAVPVDIPSGPHQGR
jgi:hypothetical protein